MKKILKIALMCTLILSLALAAGCGGQKPEESSTNTGENTGTPAAETKVYKVGTDAAYAPFESVAPSGELEGFDMDVLTAVAKEAGIEIEFVNTAWEGIFASLSSGKNDILISAVTITDERKKEMDFSEQYFESTNYIAVPEDSAIKAMTDIKGKNVSVQQGTTGDEALTKLLGTDYAGIKRFKGTPEAFLELRNKKVDATVADSGVVANYITNNPDAKLKIVKDETFPKEYYGIAVAKGNTELLTKINDGLKKIKENGEYDNIYKKWFGAK